MTDRDRDVLERCAAVIVDVSELPDRNSPADEPDMMLVTGDELRTIVMRHFALDLPLTSAEDGPQLECLATLAADLNTMNSRSNAAAVKWAVARLRALTSAREVTDEMVEHALQARVPGGSEVQDWFRPIGPKLLREIIEVALRAALASAPQPACVGERFRHKNRGTTYAVIGHAQVQCPPDAPLTEYEVVTVYRSDEGPLDDEHGLWVRRKSEFEDGRFEAISPAPSPQAGGEKMLNSLARFASEAFAVSWEGCDLEGGEIQGMGVRLGLLVETKYDPKAHGEHDAEPGDRFYVYSDEFKALRLALSARREG